VHVDVEVDVRAATLLRAVPGAGEPGARARPGVVHARQMQAAPLATRGRPASPATGTPGLFPRRRCDQRCAHPARGGGRR